MTNYSKGVRLEREVINIFKKHGYGAARTAGSHSPFDVILWKQTEENKKICFVAFVQCKVKLLTQKEQGQPNTPGHSPEQLSKLLSKS